MKKGPSDYWVASTVRLTSLFQARVLVGEGGDQDLSTRPRQGDPPDGEQVAQVEVHPDAEHQQDDPDLGQLGRHLQVGHEAGCSRAERDAGQEVADMGDRRSRWVTRPSTKAKRRLTDRLMRSPKLPCIDEQPARRVGCCIP